MRIACGLFAGHSRCKMSTEIQSPRPLVFWHCGMMRTGTTYLQSSVFPFFEGIRYIGKDQYAERSKIRAGHPDDRYLVSYEVYQDHRGSDEIRAFAQQWPEACPILVLREQGDWLRSEYKRLLKNGVVREFSEVWDPENPNAIYQPSDLRLAERIALLEDCFTTKPRVLLYEDLKADGLAFVEELARITGAKVSSKAVGVSPKHVSYTDRELRAFRAVTKYITLRRQVAFEPAVVFRAQRLFRDCLRYLVLYGSRILPMRAAPLVSPEVQEAVHHFYEQDWAHCRGLASRLPIPESPTRA